MSLFALLIVALMLILAIALPFVFVRRVTGGRSVSRRPLPALDELNSALARAAETGQPIHLSPGAGALHGTTINPETFAGLLLAQRVTDIAASRGATVSASSGDAVSHLALRGMIRSAYRDAGYSEDYDPDSVCLYADHDPLAFAVGMSNRVDHDPMDASVTVGAFGESYLVFGEPARQRGIKQVAGTADQSSLVGALLTADGTLIGEEIYAAETYTNPSPMGITRLLTHDALRWVLIVILIVGILLVTLADFGILATDFPLLPR